MTFPNKHLLLTLHWTNSAQPLETGQCGLRFDSTVNASQALVSGCATAVSSFWSAATASIPSDYSLRFLRLASIDTNGKYVTASVAFDHTYTTPVAGGVAGSVTYPLQVASVASLVTALPRGQAHAGRIYLPPLATGLQGDKKWSSADVTARANVLAGRINDLNVALPGKLTIFSFGTKGSSAGGKQVVTGVKIGGRPDVQRRRAKQVTESYGATATVT